MYAVQAFSQFYEDPALAHALSIVKDGFAINYGTGGIGSEIIANRLGVGPMANCVECKYEEFFLTALAVGDPAMIVDTPANLTVDPVTLLPNGERATKALYPDDPSNVHHSYMNDHIKFRQLHAGPKEHHIFHLHAHQWQYNWNDPNSNYLDSQGIGPGSGFTYEIAYGGSGNRNKAPGDSIFHCHFYPHFAMGMWELWRTHDTFELGTELSANGVPVEHARALPDGEILAGTPIPGIVPLPSVAPIMPNQGRPVKVMAPMPDSKAAVVAFDGNGDGILDSSQYDLDSNGVADLVDGFNVVPDSNPGFPFYMPGVAGHRPPTPALDIVYDGGLPRHIITGGQQVGVTHEQYQTRLDFNKELLNVGYLPIPETGTPAEVVAMQYHEALWHESYLPDGTPVNPANPILAMSGRPIEGFETNGLPPQPGAPFADPCRVDPTAANGWAVGAVAQNKIYKGVNIQIDLTMNKVGGHFPQQRILTLWDDAQPVIAGTKAPEPLVMRLNAGDCASYWHANLVPNVYELDDYQVRTPTDIIGQHIHLVKFDVTSSDGSANGFNYEDGTLSPMEVQERIHAITANGCSNFECPQAEVHPFFGAGPDHNGDGVGDWVGARTTVQRWYADAMLNSSWDNGLGTVFTHDHYGPSTHQQVGLYATVLIEPTGAQYRDPESGKMMGTRHDGGPTSWRADIINIYDSTGRDMSHREFYFEFADFQHAYLKGGGDRTMVDNGDGVSIPSYADFPNAINPSFRVQPPPGYEASLVYFPPICPDGSPRPCPEAISGDDPGTYVVNYRNEPIAERVYDPATKKQAAGQAGDLAYAFSSLITRAIPELNLPFNAYPPLTQGVDPSDPATPLLRVYMGDKVRLRVQVGAHEEEHNFMIHGLKWKKEPLTGNSGWKDAEFMGISEYAIMEMPILPDIGPGTPQKTDYLYTMGAQVEDYWNGIWGIMRSYNKFRSDLKPLPNNPIGTDPLVFTNEADFKKVCPIDSPMVNIKVTAVRAADILPGGTLVYNDRSTTVFGPVAYDPITGEPIQFGPVGQGPLHDPSALMYVRNEDLVLNAMGKPVGLKPGVPVEPLILRARAGDCIKLQLTNALPASLTWTGPDGSVYPDMPGFSTLPSIVHKSFVNSPEFGNGLITFNANDLTPSSAVGLHPQLVSYNVREADGFAAGRNSLDSVVLPGEKKTYTWYAGDIDMVPDTTTAAINDYKLVATPVEFGATGLLPADRIKGSNKGLVGALIVEPLGSTWVEDPASRAAATVTKADGSQFREFVTIIQNDINFRYAGNSSACQPSVSNLFCAVHSIASEGGFTPEDPQDSAQKAINYGADPMWFRLGVAPETPFESLNDRTDLHSAFSNSLVGGDPQTAVYWVSPYGPDQVRMRVVAPGGHARGIVYTLDGHSWQRSPYIKNSTEIGENNTAWWAGSQEGIGAGSIFDMVVSTRSDPSGDYLFRDFASFGSYQGLWGIMRKDVSEPMAKADIFTTAKNTIRNVAVPGVLKNDVDLDGDTFTAQLTSGTRTTAGGTIALNANGSFKYTPPSNFTGTDTFQYKVCPTCSPTTVSINVGKAPVAALDSYSILAGTPSLTLPAPGLLSNDKDPDGDPFIIGEVNGSNLNVGRQVALASGSTLMINEDGSMIYEPAVGFAGKDTFTYAICENIAGGVCSNVVTNTIKINAAPTAAADSFTAKKNTKLTIAKPGVMVNDLDLNLDTLKAVLVTNPNSGTLTLKTDGSFAYTPAKNFIGTVVFTYKVCETATTDLLCSNIVTATITVK
ncbi:MAG TPA: Ig-like domain-containing protein [Anaerolineales bacterium]|nr:Ig-like domain-containing protein [Anaerolineales bacterium]